MVEHYSYWVNYQCDGSYGLSGRMWNAAWLVQILLAVIRHASDSLVRLWFPKSLKIDMKVLEVYVSFEFLGGFASFHALGPQLIRLGYKHQ